MIKKNYIYLLIFVLLLFLLDRGIGLILKKNFGDVSVGVCGSINQSINSNGDMLIFGSSRANHHYIPEILSNQLGLSCYNAGIGGYGIFYNYAIINLKAKTTKPKVIILDLAPNVVVDPESYSKLNALLPYIYKDSSFLDIVKLNPDYSIMNRVSMLYRYNSTLYEIIKSLKSDSKISDGYNPLSGSISSSKHSFFYLESENIDQNKLLYFNKIIDICIKNSIKLYVFVSPTFDKFDKNNSIINVFAKICKESSIPFYDFSDLEEVYGKGKYFKDQLHLNNDGAEVYTKKVAKELQNQLKK